MSGESRMKCEKNGLKIVAIKKPTDWNLCVICEEIKDDAPVGESEA